MQERANVFADDFIHRDGEAAISGDIKRGTCLDGYRFGASIEAHAAVSGDDFHALWSGGAEMIGARKNEAERLLGAVLEMHGVGDDFAVEIHIGFSIDGDLREGTHDRLGV